MDNLSTLHFSTQSVTHRGGNNEANSSWRINTVAVRRALVVGATNLPKQLDEALLCEFGKRITLPLPDEAPYDILRALAVQQSNVHPEIRIEAIQQFVSVAAQQSNGLPERGQRRDGRGAHQVIQQFVSVAALELFPLDAKAGEDVAPSLVAVVKANPADSGSRTTTRCCH